MHLILLNYSGKFKYGEINMKMSKKNKKKVIGIVIFFVLILLATVTNNQNLVSYIEQSYNIDLSEKVSSEKENAELSNLNEYEVVRVVDGDTIVVNYNGTNEKVRLIGVDTPESVHPNESKNTEEGVITSNYTKERLTGKTVKLEFDVQERDKYGRLLAYVYLDNYMYNKELLEKGYAKVATYPPNVKYVEDFTKLQEKAREEKVGLWN